MANLAQVECGLTERGPEAQVERGLTERGSEAQVERGLTERGSMLEEEEGGGDAEQLILLLSVALSLSVLVGGSAIAFRPWGWRANCICWRASTFCCHILSFRCQVLSVA